MTDDPLIYLPHEEMAKLALSMYLGERCLYCHQEFKTMDDLKEAVFTGCHEVDGVLSRISHRTCWVAAGSPRGDAP